uniref:Uncharacterized protein n=1 Tax=viral metagenome TaxID=1070528 RepID=A0A6C0CAH2_9ZZZZ
MEENKYFENKNIELRKKCMRECSGVKDKDTCYSDCVFMKDFEKCMSGRTSSGIPQCQPSFFGPNASKYGELPK